MTDIKKILSSLGLVESEVKTYLAALENGSSTVIELSKETKLSRQATYTAIDSLTDRGLMTSTLTGKKRLYTAEHPDHLLAYAQRREKELEETVKDLKRNISELELKMAGDKPIVKVYEGKEGIHAMIESLEKTKSGVFYEIGDLDAIFKVLSLKELDSLRKVVSRKKTKMKTLYAGKPQTERAQNRYFLPNKYTNFKTNIIIEDNQVTIVSFEGKMHSVIIESKSIAQTLKILFELSLQSKDLHKK